MSTLDSVISDELANEVIGLLEKLNHDKRYWISLYWEFQEDATQLFLSVQIMNHQNNEQNIQAVTCLFRSILSPLLPSSEDKFTWCAAIYYEGEHVGGAMGGIKDDWKSLGMET